MPHGSPTHTAHPQSHLGVHRHTQPTLLSYPPSGPLVTNAPMAHLLASPGATRNHIFQPAYGLSHPAGHLVHQVTVGLNRLLPSPTLHPQGQFKPLFPHHSFITSPVYAGFPLSPTKLNQYPYIWDSLCNPLEGCRHRRIARLSVETTNHLVLAPKAMAQERKKAVSLNHVDLIVQLKWALKEEMFGKSLASR